jgi:hypothetical protein
VRVFWPAGRFAEFVEQAPDAVGGALVTVGFTVPAADSGVAGELPLQAQAVPEPRRVSGGGDEFAQAR